MWKANVLPLLQQHVAEQVDSMTSYMLLQHEAAVANLLEVLPSKLHCSLKPYQLLYAQYNTLERTTIPDIVTPVSDVLKRVLALLTVATEHVAHSKLSKCQWV